MHKNSHFSGQQYKNIVKYARHIGFICYICRVLPKGSFTMATILYFIFVVLANIFMFMLLLGAIWWAIFIIFYLPYAAAKGKLGKLPWL